MSSTSVARPLPINLATRLNSLKPRTFPEGPDAQRIINQMASENPKLIILGSFGYMNDGMRLAAKRPDIDFIHASGYKTTQNFGWFLARNYESAYVAGLAAGYVTKSKILGVVAAYPIPEVLAMINGLTSAHRKLTPMSPSRWSGLIPGLTPTSHRKLHAPSWPRRRTFCTRSIRIRPRSFRSLSSSVST